jgi:uncharacterized protein
MVVGGVTALYAGLTGLLLLFLSWRVTQFRRSEKVGLGDGGNSALQRAIRVQANFVEYAPTILVLILVLEINGTSPAKIHALGIALLAARLLHALGLAKSAGYSFGRFYGTALTWVVLLLAALLAIASFFGYRI